MNLIYESERTGKDVCNRLQEGAKASGKRSTSKSQSTANITSEETGQMFTDADEISQEQIEALAAVWDVLFKARTAPFTTKVMARSCRPHCDVGRILLTTKMPDGQYANVWMITDHGKWMSKYKMTFSVQNTSALMNRDLVLSGQNSRRI